MESTACSFRRQVQALFKIYREVWKGDGAVYRRMFDANTFKIYREVWKVGAVGFAYFNAAVFKIYREVWKEECVLEFLYLHCCLRSTVRYGKTVAVRYCTAPLEV